MENLCIAEFLLHILKVWAVLIKLQEKVLNMQLSKNKMEMCIFSARIYILIELYSPTGSFSGFSSSSLKTEMDLPRQMYMYYLSLRYESLVGHPFHVSTGYCLPYCAPIPFCAVTF